MNIITRLGEIWRDLKRICKRICKVLNIARVSIFMVIFSAILLLRVPQTTDAIIALLNSDRSWSHILFCLVALLWALLIWYWARVFYYLAYYHKAVKPLECTLIIHTPRILGGASLFMISLAFFIQEYTITEGKFHVVGIGTLFLVLTAIFLFFVYFRQKIFQLKRIALCKKHPDSEAFLSIKQLPRITQKLLWISTILSALFLLFFIVYSTRIPAVMAAITVILCCLCIWIPLLYWISYASNTWRIPLFLLLFIIMCLFSLFNQNKNVRLLDPEMPIEERRTSITEYFATWYEQRKKGNTRIPLIIVLSEGGGIRAAYWSGCLLARIQDEIPEFSSHLFAINGVSGGSFGAAVFASLVKYSQKTEMESLQRKAKEIIGQDYLSPVVASMFSGELVQLFVPFPISPFDHAKVFEKKWEMTWNDVINDQKETNYFSDPFLSLWKKNDSNFEIPALFINITRVENGMPVLVSHLKLVPPDPSKPENIIEDFYVHSQKDIRLSTAALLSARFPYVGPAGILTTQKGKTIGLVDGGYFENTGANTAYETYMNIKGHLGEEKFRSMIEPVVIYLKNGSETPDVKRSGRSLYYQLSAPISTLFQIRDSHTKNAIDRIQEFVEMHDGQFREYFLETKRKGKAQIPLGWSLSKETQEQIDKEISDRIDDVVQEIKSLLPDKRQ